MIGKSYSITDPDELINRGLFDQGVNFLYGEIAEKNVAEILKWITYENIDSSKKNLTLYINSTGGSLYDTFALIDAMNASHIPIHTVGLGSAMSAAFLILVSGHKTHRFVAPNTGLMCHQFSDEVLGKHHDIKAGVVEVDHCYQRMLDILVTASDQDEKWVKKHLLASSDQFFTAQQLIDLNLADKLFQKI